MITPFFGELFFYPIPLELSHNYCSNKCAYCFANLNKPDRTADVIGVANQIKKMSTGKSLTAGLLRSKAAICISNKTDPFATSNYRIAIPEIKTLIQMGNPIAYHTRGGKHFDEFYENNKIPKSLFYISICQTDDEIRKKVEPGATTIEYRWAMAKKLVKDGHQVIIGLNPFVRQWNDTKIFLKNVKAAGVKNVLVQPIHLNSEQIVNMTAKEQKAMTDEVLTAAKKRYSPYADEIEDLINKLIAAGVNAYDSQNFNKTHIMDAWHKGLGGKTFKTYYDFYHWCRKNKKNNDAVFFEEFYDFMKPEFFEENTEYTIYQYITSIDRRYRKTRQYGLTIKSKMTFRELCLMYWNEEKNVKNISKIDNFALIAEIKDEQLIVTADENGNYMYAFNDKGFEFSLINPINVNTYV